MVAEVKDYEFSSWDEYIDKNSTLCPLCDTRTVLNRMPISELNELVNEPLSNDIVCLDIEDASKGRPSDDQVMMLIKEKTGATNSSAFQQLPADIKKSVLHDLSHVMKQDPVPVVPSHRCGFGIAYGVVPTRG